MRLPGSLQGIALWAIALAQVPSQVLGSLDPGRSMHHYVRDTWGAQDGLPHDAIRAIVQTRDGYIWLGTAAGVVRFDGIDFKNFGRRAFPELPSDFVLSLVEGPEGALWAGFVNGGVHKLRDGVWQSFEEADRLSHQSINTLFADSEGTIWAGAMQGLFTIKGGHVEALSHEELRDARVEELIEDDAGRIWVATHNDGLFRIGDEGIRRFGTLEGMPENSITSLLLNPDGSMWAGTANGSIAVVREDRVDQVWSVEAGSPGTSVITLLRDAAGTVWVGTLGGLARVVNEKPSSITAEIDVLADRRVLDILEDLEGNLWVGTYGGLMRFKNARLTTYGVEEGLVDDFVRSIHEAEDGALWVASVTGIARKSGGAFEVPPWIPTEGWPNIRTVLEDRSNALWVGTESGVFRYLDGAWSRLGIENGLRTAQVLILFEDSDGVLWIGTQGGGLRQWNGRRFVSPGGAEALERLTVTAFHEDHTGVFWAGTSIGVFARRHGAFLPVPFDSHPNAYVRHIHEDEDGTLWFGTMAAGLFRFRDGHVTRYSLAEGLPDDSVWMVLESSASPTTEATKWMCSDLGIFAVPNRELDAVAEGTLTRLSPRRFGISDGMRALECNGIAQPSGICTRDNRLWFPTAGGAVEIAPEVALAESDYVPPLVIHEVLVNGTPAETAGGFTLEGGSNDLEFRFAALNYTEPGSMRFRYRVEGYDADWIDVGTRRWAHYANFPPGRYRFVVNAGADGVWYEPVVGTPFLQSPRWYQETWFVGVAALLIGTLLLGGYRFRVESLERRQKELEERVVARTIAEEEQRRAKEHLLSIYDNATFGIYSGTREGRLLDVNPALVQMLGYGSAKELLAADRLVVYPKADQHAELIEARTHGDTFKDVEVEWRTKGGTPITVRLNGRTLPHEDPPVYVTIAEDITGERTLEERLRQTQKMEAVGRLAGGIAHDFNNLLTVIMGHADQLLHQAGADKGEQSEAREIFSAAERAAALTHQLLAFSRKNVSKPRIVQLNDIIRALEPMLRRLIGEDHVVTTELERRLAPVLADSGNLEQALVNLMLNARDAMPDGGRIVVRTFNREVRDGNESGARPGHYVAMIVEDTGVGMDEETRRRIFEPFFTTKSIGKGTGLGLSMVYGTVRQAGGFVSVNSRLGRGTVFEILLPRAKGIPEIESSFPVESCAKVLGEKTVLVVEDEAPVREIVMRTLESAGYHVLVAALPDRAREVARAHVGSIDLLVTDVMMPAMKGTELAVLLRKERPEMQVLFISGYADGALVQEQVHRNTSQFLGKPFKPGELVARVAKILETDTPGR